MSSCSAVDRAERRAEWTSTWADITTSDFERVPERIPLGESAARKMADAVRRYAVPTSEYVAWRTRVTSSQQIDARLSGVRFEGLDHVNPDYLATRSEVKAGEVVDTSKISQEAQRMSVLRDFESVGYRLEGDPNAPRSCGSRRRSAGDRVT